MTQGAAKKVPTEVTVEVDPQQEFLIDGEAPVTVADGIPVVSLAGPTGDLLDTENGGLRVTTTNPAADIVRGGDVRPQGNEIRSPTAAQRVTGSFMQDYFVNPSTGTQNSKIWDVASYRGVSVQIISGSGTVTFQGSNDGVTWVSTALYSTAGVGTSNPQTNNGATTGIWAGMVRTRYFRLNCVTNATSAIITFFTDPIPIPPSGTLMSATQNASMGQAVGVALIGQYDDIAPTLLTEGNGGNARASRNRSLYQQIRDGSTRQGEWGAEVGIDGAITVRDVTADLIGGQPIATAAPGVQAVALTGPTGDLLQETSGALHVIDVGASQGGIPSHQPDIVVSSTPVMLMHSNAVRKAAIIQNIGPYTMRVTLDGYMPSDTYGLQLGPGATLDISEPHCPTGQIWAVREGSSDTNAAVMEVV